jgi:integrase
MDPDTWWLHKFRATFATHGIDLRTVQDWMGYTDLASAMRYLRPARGQKVQAQVEALLATKKSLAEARVPIEALRSNRPP